jgi:quinohemoprotein ethanol dehydrogenase
MIFGNQRFATAFKFLAIGLLVPVTLAASPTGHNASMFTDDSDGKNWPSVGRTYSETYYSPLSQINQSTIKRLRLAWFIDLPTMISAVSTPLAVNGKLFFAVGYSVVSAVDSVSGKVLWTYDPKVTAATNDKLKPAWGIRGLAYADDRVFVGTQDGRLISLAANNGALLWSTQTVDPNDGRYITGPPRVFNGKVIIGHGGADGWRPVRGYVTAYDVQDGHQVWRFYLVPGDPAKGFENEAMKMAAKTWTGEWWKYGGGGTAWNAMTYDAKYNRIYIGTGNGQPWNQKIRSPGGGDNLFLCSIVALDADTGEYVWHYQTTPGEEWDYNSVMDIQLATLNIDGQPRDVILHAPKNGFFYVLDRATGKLISAEPFTTVTWANAIDKKTARPIERPEARNPNGEVVVTPSGSGGHNWSPMSFSPKTRLVYIPTNYLPGRYDSRGMQTSGWNSQEDPTGYNFRGNGDVPDPDNTTLGALQAWDPVAQKRVWSVPFRAPYPGGALSTAGDLVFEGCADGTFQARDAATGKLVWSFDAQNGILGEPISYEAGGKQYITLIAGYATSPPVFGPVAAQFGWQYRTQQRRVLTFVLDGNAALPPRPPPDPLRILDDPTMKLDLTKVERGAAMYNTNCMICHGAGAIAGGNAPDLRASPIPLSAEAFRKVVHDGALREKGMAKFQELSGEDVEAVRQFIRARARRTLQKTNLTH